MSSLSRDDFGDIAAKYHKEPRDEVRSGVVDDRNEEFSVSDTGWYRMETAVQRQL